MDMLMPGKTELVTLWLEENCRIYPHVIFESMMASLAIGRYHELRKRLGPPGAIIIAFMNTPLEVCRERIFSRNGGKGPTGKGINEAATVDHQWHRIRQIHDRLMEKHEECIWFDYENSYEEMKALLRQNGWDPMSTPPPTHEKVKTRVSLESVYARIKAGLYPDQDVDRNKRFAAEVAKHADRFPE
jgi:hypothetical protein